MAGSPPVCVLQGDRFIPDRSALDMDMAHYLLTEPRKDKENAAASPSKEAYRRLLAEKLLNNRTRILSFRNKPPEPENVSFADAASSNLQAKPAKQRRHIPQVCAIDLLILLLAILCNGCSGMGEWWWITDAVESKCAVCREDPRRTRAC